jgi:hypothetical protein
MEFPSMKPRNFTSKWSPMYVNRPLSGVDKVLIGQVIGHATNSQEGKRLFAELGCTFKLSPRRY